MSKKTDLFGDEGISSSSNEGVSFERMFEESTRHQKLKVGDTVQAEILSIGPEESFVSLGGAIDGQLATRELKDTEGKPKFKVGDFISVVILKVREGEVRVRRQDAKTGAGETESLEDAMDMEIPVEGKVLEMVKGGFRVSIQGVRAFCPLSQMDLRPITDGAVYVDKKFEFLVTQMDGSHKNVIVSRRKLLELQRAEFEGEWLTKVQPGDLVEGKITKLEPFGAFVDLGNGIEGLVHVSEISWTRIKAASEVLSIGQAVRVKVLKIEDGEGRLKISLSLKQGGSEADPWSTIETQFPLGHSVPGTVEKKEVFGLFVTVAPGITGLLPKAKWRDLVEGAQYESKKRGDMIQVQVDHIDTTQRRLSLGIPGEKTDESWKSHSGGSQGLGTFADLFQKAQKPGAR